MNLAQQHAAAQPPTEDGRPLTRSTPTTRTLSRRAARAETERAREAHRHRRARFMLGAAVASVALTATAMTSTLAGADTPARTAASSADLAAGTPLTADASPAADVDPTAEAAVGGPLQEALDTATVALVRAELVAAESGGAVSAERLERITTKAAQLREIVASTSPTIPADPADLVEDALESPTPLEAATDEQETLEATGVPDVSGAMTDRLTERASRSDGRAPLDSLLGDLPLTDTLEAPATTGDDTTDADVQAPDPEPSEEVRDALAERAGSESTARTEDAADEPTTADSTADGDALSGDDAPSGTDVPEGDDAPERTEDAASAAVPAGGPDPEEITRLTESLTSLLDDAQAGLAIEVAPAPPTEEELAAEREKKAAAERKKKEAERAAQRAEQEKNLEAWARSTEGYSNGTIPTDVLCEPSFAKGHYVRCDAAFHLEDLNEAYKKAFGSNLSITSSYRSYASQVAVKASRGVFAAPPGTSNHGWGQALDLGGGINSFGTPQYQWMRENAPKYGWDNPTWARAGGSLPEPWHWEYGTDD